MKPLHLIIVEDSDDDVFLLMQELKRGGFEPEYIQVETAEDFQAALEEKQCQLVISDHGLPAFSAPEALELLNRSGRDLPFIIVSSVIGEDVAVAAMKAGAHDYIMKKNLTRLVPVIDRALQDAVVRKERKKTREALTESEARFRRIADNVRDIIYRIDVKPFLHFEFISPAVKEVLGYEPEEFYNNPQLINKLIHPEESQQLQDALKGFIQDDQPLLFKWVHKNGQLVWIEISNTPVYDDDKKMVALEGIARDVSERIHRDEQLRESYNQVQALSNGILNAMEEERARLARELHDELGQALTAVKLDLQLLGEELNPDETQLQLFKQSIALVDHTINLVRRQSISLRPPQLDDMGLFAALNDMIGGFKRRTGMEVNFIYENNSDRYPGPVETALYRCVQESLTNIARHARAKKTDIVISTSAGGDLLVKVIDDGVGFNQDSLAISTDHIGLTGMRERVKLLGGEFSIESKPGCGTSIEITVPHMKKRNGSYNDESITS
jgi:PAS domain S-box-containing protein